MKQVIRVGTRGSKLALVQTEMVIAELKNRYPDRQFEIVVIHTQGDRLLDKPLAEFGGKGVFINEFEAALLAEEIDLAVHSAKDMPMKLADGLVIAGVLPRADVRDVLITKKGLSEIRVIGTGSIRRKFQLGAFYPDVQCVSIRGNVPTRLQKVRNGECDGIVLAVAGLERLGLLEEPDLDYRYFSAEEMVPAGGQGIIAIEGRENDKLISLVNGISHHNTMLELETERKVLQLLNTGCHEAVGVTSEVNNGEISIEIIKKLYGTVYRRRATAVIDKNFELAEQLVDSLELSKD